MAHAYTKELIQKAVVDCLDEMPLNKISVTEIARRCEINRNTFYYYYPDIYAVLSEIFDVELNRVIGQYSATQTWEEGFIQATIFAQEHRRAIYHVYRSMQREDLERFIQRISEDVMMRFVQAKNQDIGASESDCRIIAVFYQCALTQMVLQWLAGGMKEDPVTVIRRTGELFNGNIELSLQRSLAQ